MKDLSAIIRDNAAAEAKLRAAEAPKHEAPKHEAPQPQPQPQPKPRAGIPCADV